MTIPRLQGWWDEIQPYAKGITDVLEQKFYPNKRLQLAMQAEVSKNPALLQQFADLKARDPEILRKIGLNNIDIMVGGLPESAESIAEKKKAGILASPTTPEEEPEIRAGVLGTRTPIERKQQEATLRGTEAGTTATEFDTLVRRALFPSTLTKAEAEGLNAEQEIDLLKKYPTGVIARNKLAGDYRNIDKLSPEEVDVLSTHPTFKANFERIRDDYWKNRNEWFMMEYRRTGRNDNLLDEWSKQVALYGGTTPLAAKSFALLPADEQKRLLESPAPASPQEEAIWRAGQGMNALSTKNEVNLQNSIMNIIFKEPAFIQATKTIQSKSATPEQKKIAIETANSVLAAKGNEIGMASPPQFELRQSGWGPWKKAEPTLIGGDLSLARAIGAKAGITINTPNETETKIQAASILEDSTKLDALAQAVKADMDQLKTQTEKDKWLATWSANKPPEVVAEVRKRLSKFTGK